MTVNKGIDAVKSHAEKKSQSYRFQHTHPQPLSQGDPIFLPEN